MRLNFFLRKLVDFIKYKERKLKRRMSYKAPFSVNIYMPISLG